MAVAKSRTWSRLTQPTSYAYKVVRHPAVLLTVQEFSVTATTMLLIQPLAIVAGIGLLIWLIGYSALVGVGVSYLPPDNADCSYLSRVHPLSVSIGL